MQAWRRGRQLPTTANPAQFHSWRLVDKAFLFVLEVICNASLLLTILWVDQADDVHIFDVQKALLARGHACIPTILQQLCLSHVCCIPSKHCASSCRMLTPLAP